MSAEAPSADEFVAELRDVGEAAGLAAVGVAPVDTFDSTRVDLFERRNKGLNADMAFTYRNPDRSTDATVTMPGARSLVVGARPYGPLRSGHLGADRAAAPVGRVARYARDDHYAELRSALDQIADRLRDAGHRAVVVADDNALVDREAAYRAGLGWYGKSSNLLMEGHGSWFVLGSVITDADLPVADSPQADGCGPCRRCIDACPTGAIVAPGVVDARRCLAWLVQARGTFPREHRRALGNRLYGCDDCQEVCPPNIALDRSALDRSALDRSDDSSARAATSHGAVEDDAGDDDGSGTVDLLDLLELSDETLLARHGRWYIADRDPDIVRRNALIAIGNIGDERDADIEATLRRYLRHENPMLRAHATWAAVAADRRDLLPGDDCSAEVRAELDAFTGLDSLDGMS